MARPGDLLDAERVALSQDPRPGDRAPNAPLVVDGAPTDLFAVRRAADFTVLTFGAAAGESPELPGSVQVLAADGVLREAYGAGDGDVVVIRPDGYVGGALGSTFRPNDDRKCSQARSSTSDLHASGRM